MASSLTSANISIIHDITKQVFRAMSADGVEVGHLDYRLVGSQTIDFYHTYTRPEAQGKGVAGKMVEKGLVWAQERHMQVVGSCSYVEAYLKRHPNYNSSL
jgi:predicted GNAT family acetyltransferase